MSSLQGYFLVTSGTQGGGSGNVGTPNGVGSLGGSLGSQLRHSLRRSSKRSSSSGSRHLVDQEAQTEQQPSSNPLSPVWQVQNHPPVRSPDSENKYYDGADFARYYRRES